MEDHVAMILFCLEDFGYEDLLEEDVLKDALSQGMKVPALRTLFAEVASNLAQVAGLSALSASPEDEDSSELIIEILSLLNEYEFLCTELQAMRMFVKNQGKQTLTESSSLEAGSGPAQCFAAISAALEIDSSLSAPEALQAAKTKVEELLASIGVNDYLGEPLLADTLSAEQLVTLEQINEALVEEYSVRRQMLLKRADVTVQSFKWSDRAKTMLDKIETVALPLRSKMSSGSHVAVQDVKYATSDLLKMSKTSNKSSHGSVESKVKGILIGGVPDRGGRPTEVRTADMPSFRKRSEHPQPQRSRGGGGGQGRGRGRGRGKGRGKGDRSRKNSGGGGRTVTSS